MDRPGEMNDERLRDFTRRHLFEKCGVGLGAIALGSLLGEQAKAGTSSSTSFHAPHRAPRAKAVIFLFMAGGPSQLDLFTDKPVLRRLHGQAPPQSFLQGKRFAFLKGTEKLLASPRRFQAYGNCGQELSDLLPHHQKIVDEVCWLRGMTTDVFNHAPAKLFVNTGSPQPGRPSMGSWVTYGIGSESRDLPGFVVLQSGPRGPRGGAALWASGFLPTVYQGVQFRGQGDPVLYLRDPQWMKGESRRRSLDTLRRLNESERAASGDPEIDTRIAAYEMAFRMQSSVPSLVDLKQESVATLARYGVDPAVPSYARNCLLARRMLERGVRFVQLYHRDWDHHGAAGTGGIDKELPLVCREVDRATAALISDLKERGLLDDTLVVWGGEFGRTPMQQSDEATVNLGRDHHRRAFTMLLAGGGFTPGLTFGATDELGFHAVENKVHVHDLQATLLHQLGFDHERLTYRFQGRDYRLTDVDGRVIREIIS